MMPTASLWLSACGLGFAVAAPLGPTGATAMRRGLEQGALSAFWIGMGAAATDLLYILATYFGLTPLLSRLPWLPVALYAAGALVLGRMGLSATLAAARGDVPLPMAGTPTERRTGRWRDDLLLGVSVTAVNPATITSWLSVGGAFVSGNLVGLPLGAALLTMVGILLGSATWFTILASVVAVARSAIGRIPWLFRGVGLLSGLLLLAFALGFVLRGVGALRVLLGA